MTNIFLSASVPLPDRDRRFFETADVFLIREAIRALVEVILPTGHITFGGHPAITPLMSLYANTAKLGGERITVYQSAFFLGQFPRENDDFADIRYTEAVQDDLSGSIDLMRNEMLTSRRFDAAVLIGGMDGILDEARLFREYNPTAKVLPIPATGAAAAIEYNEGNYSRDLANEISFASLFRRKLLPNPLL
ncbi:hypothetical protein DS901_18130 [Loktanella sp. D2R18]|uniref:SLOG domain-containing protein n=1 Tax=Rhodobacterales TaxID=204455 RepID=UPI000DEA9886|nr:MULTISPECIES: hypothetical protein [Rhodobacterales]MDO6590514.1 hypothetical protein [Yoonia sp. 1_MG-2023]RBW41231.1 hypothetical protein DS901_18130 [Loktanella sp. D2R18]